MKKKDEHICPLCGSKQTYIGDTYVCEVCNIDAYEDLMWCEKWKKKNIQLKK